MCDGSGPVLHADVSTQPRPIERPRPFDNIPIPPEIPRTNPFDVISNVVTVRSVDPVIGSLTCTNIVNYMGARIVAEKLEGINRAEYDTSIWTALCSQYGKCALNDLYIGNFCDDWNLFMSRRTVAQAISSGFNARFGSTAAAPGFPNQPPLPAFDMGSENTGNTTGTSDSPITPGGGPVPFAPVENSTDIKSSAIVAHSRLLSVLMLTFLLFSI
jgi:hypothetical protein